MLVPFGMARVLPLAVLLLACPAQAAAAIDEIRIDGTVVEADFALEKGSGTLTIRFESVSGLTVESLGLSIGELDPESRQALERLMPGFSLPTKFPVQIRIEPPADGGLSFTGVVAVELHTHDLVFTESSRFRMLSAPHDGIFDDVTESVSAGSIRPKSTKGSFSDFVVGIDNRPLAEAIESKFLQLAAVLDEHESWISPELHAELENLCSAAAGAYASGDIVPAIEYLQVFHDRVKSESGAGVPDAWRASGDLINVAGLLRAATDTLRYSLTLVANHPGSQSGKPFQPKKSGRPH